MLVQGLLHTSKDNKENVDPEKDFQTTEALVLRDMFPSRSSLLQYVNGMLCSDGSVGIRKKGPHRFQANVRICQSNLAFLTAINKEFDNTGYISLHSARDNIQEGRYSNGELRQTLTFYGMFDGDGGITVPHNDKAGRSRLELNITQEKCPAVLKAIQALYPGTLVHNPHRLKWVAADIIPAVYKALGSNLILRRQKLNTLLTHLFKVDTTKDPIVVNPNPRVSEVMT
ncbi:hypothetical protein WJX77_001518 [Trebouxia sp. C0004]